jgi:hypothetical protein
MTMRAGSSFRKPNGPLGRLPALRPFPAGSAGAGASAAPAFPSGLSAARGAVGIFTVEAASDP